MTAKVTTCDQVPVGTFCGGRDSIEAGTFHGGRDSIEAGTFHA